MQAARRSSPRRTTFTTIVFNLAENGIKYNRPGGALLLQVERRDETVILTVADTGIGIPDDAMAHIFERFYRVDKARSRQAGGTGWAFPSYMIWPSGTSARSKSPTGTQWGHASR